MQGLRGDRAGSIDFRPAASAVDQRRQQVGCNGGQPVIEQVLDLFIRSCRPPGQAETGEAVGDCRRDALIGGLDLQPRRANVRTPFDQLTLQAGGRERWQVVESCLRELWCLVGG